MVVERCIQRFASGIEYRAKLE
jgi:hypothetical protein